MFSMQSIQASSLDMNLVVPPIAENVELEQQFLEEEMRLMYVDRDNASFVDHNATRMVDHPSSWLDRQHGSRR